jgi:putative transposase
MLDKVDPVVSVSRQCRLLNLPRSSVYYAPRSDVRRRSNDLVLMNRLDELYIDHPFYGVRRMTHQLRSEGHDINPKHVRRLLRLMGMEAIYARPRLSQPGVGHKVYPYLLKGLKIKGPDHVWCCDITYIRLHNGFAYLMAVMDWFSRFVLSWSLSNTMEASWCVDTLKRALGMGTPELFNTDQGSQFTSDGFVGTLTDAGIRVSMDGRGRALDNVYIERLWRSVKQEDVYLRDYANVRQARAGIGAYFEFYNHTRIHQSLAYKTPWAAYTGQTSAEVNPLPVPLQRGTPPGSLGHNAGVDVVSQ